MGQQIWQNGNHVRNENLLISLMIHLHGPVCDFTHTDIIPKFILLGNVHYN